MIIYLLISTVLSYVEVNYREANNGPVCEKYVEAGLALWDFDPTPGTTYYNSAEQIDEEGNFFNEKYENNMRVRGVQCCSDPDSAIVTGIKLKFKNIDSEFAKQRDYNPFRKFYAGPDKSFDTDCIGRSCDTCGDFKSIDAPITSIDFIYKTLDIDGANRKFLLDLKFKMTTNEGIFFTYACGQQDNPDSEGALRTVILYSPMLGLQW